MRTRWVVAVVLLLAVGCSKGSGASVPPPLQVDKATAISDGDTLCQQFASDDTALLAQFHQQHPKATDADARDFAITTLIPRVEKFVGDFHRIGEPTTARTDWDNLVENLDSDLATYQSGIDASALANLGNKPFQSRKAEFTTFGFKTCPTALS